MSKEVQFYDVTLRDGAQTEGVSFSIKDKIRILNLLDEIGMSYIEGGWPGANPKDTELFEIMKKEKLKNAILVAFGSTRRGNEKAEDSVILRNLIEAETPHVNIFAKGWDFHVHEALKISLEENLDIVYDSVSYLKKYVDSVALGVEHFFDGYKANPEYVKKIIQVAQDAGATWVSAADTNGGCMTEEIGSILTEVRKDYDILKSVHIHQDTGLAIANTIKSIECGCTIVHGTINGLGERCGMTDFCTLIPDLKLKMGIDCISSEQLARMREISLIVSQCSGLKVSKYAPYVGQNAFYHKGGVHVDAMLKNPKTYNHISPDEVGNVYSSAVSELSGKANILFLAGKYGIDIDKKDPRIVDLLNYIKVQENFGFQYDGADTSSFLLFKRILEGYESHIKIEDYSFEMRKIKKSLDALHGDVIPEVKAHVKMLINGQQEEIAHSNTKGPIIALKEIIFDVVKKYYQDISENLMTIDLKISVIDFTSDDVMHRLRVLLDIKDASTGEILHTVGASHDIYTAYLKALIDAIEYKIIKQKEKG